ncbi:ATP-binding cassette domain-containing protein [Patescibacteria group bacterium]|nr:ATP-binding cassette domain-containing protein [Patescibacteria group bacterium]MBU4000403.1 ATP-binding cassette domain-containing protein [Patescibacteria group bacterium]MBU4056475.1 ATP-binding cassette domain-containing protein [Patescibacteria group bacterium]MBU4368539.1 ATP-binding cassette domain-containing protein [Patescibacteria group bacterium]
MIIFKEVSKVYYNHGSVLSLDNINLEISRGEFVSVVGQSGAGKSTLLKLIIVEERPTSGEIFFDKLMLSKVSDYYLPNLRRNIGVVFQDFRMMPNKTIYENVAFTLEVLGRTNEEIDRDVLVSLDIMGIKDKSGFYPRQLSGGEQQRAALARAIVHHPAILIADELTGNLDLLNTWEIIKLLTKINEMGTTIILATHNREIVNSLNKRVVTLDKGRIAQDQATNGKYII